MRFKFYLYFFSLVCLLAISLFFLYTLNDAEYYKNLSQRLEIKLEKETTTNRFRIEQFGLIVEGIAEKYPVVGQALNDVLVDLKENRMYQIDQRISDLPEEMQEFIVMQNIECHGLFKYGLPDDYGYPVDESTSYIPEKYGEFGWRPKVFDEHTYQYVYKESIKNGVWVLHDGSDIVSQDPRVKATNYGYVLETGRGEKEGKFIVIEHRFKGKPLRRTYYYHLNDILVEKGAYVSKKQIVATTGKTGKFVTDTHLHYGMKEWDGKRWVNINPFIGTTHNRKWLKGYYWIKRKVVEEYKWFLVTL